MQFTHLHVHSHYSLLDGLAKIDELLNRAKDLGMDSIAITDHGALYGAIEFFIKAKEKGIKPIIGCEMYVTPGDYHSRNNTVEDKTRYHLILLCRNEKGYKNLMKLITISHLEGFYYKPRINKELLKKYAEGLIGMSACIEGEIPAVAANGDAEKAERLALEYQTIFEPGHFYLEIQRHPRYPKQEIANQALIKISQKHNIPLVATNDIHYVHKNDAPIQDILLCIQTNRKVSETNRLNMLAFDLYLKSPAEMIESFQDIPEAIANTQKIVADCNLEIKLGETQLPHFKVPEGKTPESLLDELTLAGLKKRFGENVTSEQKSRMEYELGVIKKTGLASYFLIVQDFINWAKNQGIIVGPGRGSAAGSFVSYLLNITNIDPIKYDLLFERFLNPERISMPDIDMDFADDRRDEVLEYVRKKYGDDHVAQIITFGTMAARAAIRDAGRALGIPYEFCDKTAKLIPMFATIPEALREAKEFKDLYATDLGAKKLIDSAMRLEGVVRHASMHACGVVITREPVTEYTPLQRIIGKESGTVTQYSSSTKSSFIEKIGLLKMDFLGLKNLTIIQNTLRIVRKIYPPPLLQQPSTNKASADSTQKREASLDIDAIPPDDKKTYALLQKALTTGVFQLESSGMKRYLKQLKPTKFEDIIAMVSLYRPGPMEWIPDFIARKNGEWEIRYLHPKLKPILEKTYGVAVYQEQVMQIAQQLAGFSLGEADVLRKAMGKKVFSLIQQEKTKFIQGCVNQGIGRNIGEQVFSFIEPFAGYGFNRCLTGETVITDPASGKQSKLEDLFNQYKNNKRLPSVSTISDLKLRKGQIIKVYNNGKKEVYRVTTRLGKTIEATQNHPFLTFGGWEKLKNLRIGDRIALNRRFPASSKKQPIKDYQLIVLGYLIAEGNLCHPHSFYFYSKDKLEIEDYSANLEKFKNTKATIDKSKIAASVYAGRIDLKEKSEAVEWIKRIGIHYSRATNKELPDLVFNLDRDQLSLLIGKMFQGDGCINIRKNNYPQIFYATSSEKLARQVQHLLLRLDIISTLHKKKFKYRQTIKYGYTLTVNRYNNISSLYSGPGRFLIGEKLATLKKIIKDHPILNGTIQSGSARGSSDIIPCEIKNIIVEAVREKRWNLKTFAKKYKVAEKLLFNDGRKKGYLRETILKIGKILNNKKLLSYAQSDVYWDEITSIEKIGKKNTYDLTITETHNYVANDFIVHNSHAACYALIGYQTAYLKAHFPAPFMAALLTSDQDNIDRVAIEVSECSEMGIEVLPPNVNESFEEFAVIPDIGNKTERIRFGLNAIKNVGHTVAHEIVEERKRNGKFKNLTDFIERVETKDLNKKSLEALAKVGAMEELGERNKILSSMENILAYSKNFQRQKISNQASLFGETQIRSAEITLSESPPADKKQCLAWEKELLGLYISDHPVKDFKKYLEKMAIPICNITSQMVGQSVTVGGVIAKIQKIYLKSQKTMLFVTIEDMNSRMELLVFPKTLEATQDLWKEDRIILASGKVSDKDGIFKLLCDRVKIITAKDLEKEKFNKIPDNQEKNDYNSRPVGTDLACLPASQRGEPARQASVRDYGEFRAETSSAPTDLLNNKKDITITLPPSFEKDVLKKLSAFFNQCQSGETKVFLIINNAKLEIPCRIKNTPGLEEDLRNIIKES